MDRVILHSDLNNFYASVECMRHPELADKPIAVCGDEDKRHGIVLAKNEAAKRMGVKTGSAVWEARLLCPELVILKPHMEDYISVSRRVRDIYYRYTDLVEPFGIDECWLDVTGSTGLFGSGERMADEIRELVKKETGVTVSIGVSFNKVFAKLGSDFKKPDAVTVFSKENFKEYVWPLPAAELLYVGPATERRLIGLGIYTIGELAKAPYDIISSKLGRHGQMIWRYANGLDNAPVMRFGEDCPIKSVGNSTTTPRDLTSNDEVKRMLCTLRETVASRLRSHRLRAGTVEIWVRDNLLNSFVRQRKLPLTTCLTDTISNVAWQLFLENYTWARPIRSVGVRASDVELIDDTAQTSLWPEAERRRKFEALDFSIDSLRRRYGFKTVLRGLELCESDLPIITPEHSRIQSAGMYEIKSKPTIR